MLRWTVRPAVVRRGLVASALVVGLVLFGVAELSASIESSIVPVADAATAAPYGGLSGAGLTVLPVVPDRPLPEGLVASAALVGTMQPLGMAFTSHGYTIGLFAKPAPAAQGWSRQLETLAIGPASLEMTFAGPAWLHGFGLLILPDSAPPDSGLRVTVRDLEGQSWTSVVPRLPASGGLPVAEFMHIDTPAGLRGIVLESAEASNEAIDNAAPIPEPGSMFIWALLGGCGLALRRWRRHRRAA